MGRASSTKAFEGSKGATLVALRSSDETSDLLRLSEGVTDRPTVSTTVQELRSAPPGADEGPASVGAEEHLHGGERSGEVRDASRVREHNDPAPDDAWRDFQERLVRRNLLIYVDVHHRDRTRLRERIQPDVMLHDLYRHSGVQNRELCV